MDLNFNQIRVPFKNLIEQKTSGYFINSRINPDHLTLANLVFSVSAGVTIYFGEFFLTFILLVLAFLTDTFDGIVARARGISSLRGNYLDSSVDRLGEAAFFIGLYLSSLISEFAVFLLGITTFLAIFFHMQIINRGGKYKPAVFEKGDRNIYFLIVLVPAIFGYLQPFMISIWVIVLLNCLAVFQLFIRGARAPIHHMSTPTDPTETTLDDGHTLTEYGWGST